MLQYELRKELVNSERARQDRLVKYGRVRKRLQKPEEAEKRHTYFRYRQRILDSNQPTILSG